MSAGAGEPRAGVTLQLQPALRVSVAGSILGVMVDVSERIFEDLAAYHEGHTRFATAVQ